MPAERQRRPLDSPTEQPVSEILVETPQAFEVDGVLIDPDGLHGELLSGGALTQKQQLIGERKPIVKRCSTFGHRWKALSFKPRQPRHRTRSTRSPTGAISPRPS